LTFDLAAEPDSADPNHAWYNHDPTFQVTGMTIENPRTETEFSFVPVPDTCDCDGVEILDDVHDPNFMTEIDSIVASQSVLPPNGLSGGESVVLALLNGTPDTLPDAALPPTLNLMHWPDALLAFAFVSDADPFDRTEVIAQIHTLTPVAPPPTPGDFNADGKVDAADYNVWKAAFGSTSDLSADANGNGTVDAADYPVWRAGATQTAGMSATINGSAKEPNRTVPEPATLAVAALPLLLSAWRVRRNQC
jgi:hypothetical protein